MKRIYQYILMAVALMATVSCSNELDETLQPAGNSTLQFVVGDFPAFGEGTQTRAAGISDAGKTDWTSGDEIFVTLSGSAKYGEQTAALTYDGNEWSLNGSFQYLEDETPSFSAIYAPCYKVVNKQLLLKDDMQLGMSEYIVGDCVIQDETITITFADAICDYSRLRIVGAIDQTLSVRTTNFIPAGTNEEGNHTYTLTTDAKGNAYLYGIFTGGATVTLQNENEEASPKQYNFTNETFQNTSYALFIGTDVNLTNQTETFVINDNGAYRFSGTSNYGIKVTGGNPIIYLAANTVITVQEGNALDITSANSTVTVGIESDMKIFNDSKFEATNGAGIFVADGSTVHITSESPNTNFSLTAIGGNGNPGIGGYIGENNTPVACGNIKISHAYLKAYSKGSSQGTYSAAIGAAGSEAFGSITIEDALVDVYRSSNQVDYIGSAGSSSGSSYSGVSGINVGTDGSIIDSGVNCYTGENDTEADQEMYFNENGIAE